MTTTHNITAGQVHRGDVFVLHGHERTAASPAVSTVLGHVHIRFVGGGDATVSADRPLTVTRTVSP
ncbi:hypothetical protein ABZ446_28680 [Streptomyces sp. NPDC005813]|uniref:hypothetical protein n=1 Tax=Streptomyces sp. NPDC005813 TaxID=3155592 RepID=UPI0034074B30